MKRFARRLINGIKFLGVVIFTFMIFPFARLFLYHTKIWIISENRRDARDNGYVLFRHIRLAHKDTNCYYAIDFDSVDYDKVKVLGNVIKFGSFKHFVFFCAARYIISSKTEGFCPSYYLILLRKRFHLFGRYVFLQHGIIKDDLIHFYKKVAKFDLFICGAKPEYEDIKLRYGYKDKEVRYTGLARFDNYHSIQKVNKQILIMPTWRRGLDRVNIKNSDYFKSWQALLNSKEFEKILIDSNSTAIFYIHPQFQEYSCLFKSDSNKVIITDYHKSDLQELIKESAMLITDFSSVFFDFGYLRRPVIYYQFDENTFFKTHYTKGYFDYRKDGFGPVCNTLDYTLNNLQQIVSKNYASAEAYLSNSKRFFPLWDANNSERIFLSIMDI